MRAVIDAGRAAVVRRCVLLTIGAPACAQIVALVAELGGAPIRYVVNGHVHPDHTCGNEGFGSRGARIVPHERHH